MIDLEANHVTQDPYPAYQALRQMGDVYYDALRKTCYIGGYQASADLLKDDQTFSSKNGGVEHTMTGNDGPPHNRVPKFLLPAFGESQIAALKERISSLADTLTKNLAGKKPADVVEAYTIPIPLTVAAWMLGIDPSRISDLGRWSNTIIHGRRRQYSPSKLRRAVNRLTGRRFVKNTDVDECRAFLKAHFHKASTQPTGGWVTDLIVQGWKQEQLSETETLDIGVLMIVAGSETTTHLLGNAILILARDPALQKKLRGDPQLLKPFIEEVLRFESPVQRRIRFTTAPTDIAGTSIPPGTTVHCLIGSANRDPLTFPEPEKFRIDREPNRHLSFGLGRHFCLGAQLARLEAFIALQALLQKLPQFSMGDSVSYIENNKLRGPRRLRISYG